MLLIKVVFTFVLIVRLSNKVTFTMVSYPIQVMVAVTAEDCKD